MSRKRRVTPGFYVVHPASQADRRIAMPVEIKLLGPGDEPVLANVAPEIFDNQLDAKASVDFLADPRHHMAVAIEDGVVVGFASGVHYFHPDKPSPELFVNEVGVAETHRRRGLGRAVVEKLLEAGRQLGCKEAWVLTDRSNPAAIRLFAMTGGVESTGHPVMFSFELR